jgi:uncharacterized repeat protein (TIGR01451 family)
MSVKTRILVVTLLCSMVALPLFAEVTVQLTASKVVKTTGKETLEPADKMKPGETVEYKAVYKNSDSKTVRDLKADLPVPAGMQFVPNTATPAAPMASTDGVTYSKLPLIRKVKGSDGQMHDEPVPVSEYRSLRWELGELPAGASKTVSARMLLTSPQDLNTQKH